MPYKFVLSYARDDHEGVLVEFFRELAQAVRVEDGGDGFMDVEAIDRGADWKRGIEEALQTCDCLVALYSPAYFRSEFCGRELAFFRQRVNAANADFEKVFKPVLWTRRPPIHPSLARYQYTYGAASDVPNKEGVRIAGKVGRYHEEFVNFVQRLASEIAETRPFARLANPPDLLTMPSAFAGAPVAPLGATRGPRYVQFVYIAGKPQEIGPHDFGGEARTTDSYQEDGAHDWRPFSAMRVRNLAENVASGLEFFTEALECDQSLPAMVRAAEEQRKLVILVVDSWTVSLPQYQAIVKSFDRQNYFNCSVLLPLNPQDPQFERHRRVLEKAVQDAFIFRSNASNPNFFRPNIASEQHLRDEIKEALTRLKANVINHGKPPCSLPPSEPKPVIHGPGGQRS